MLLLFFYNDKIKLLSVEQIKKIMDTQKNQKSIVVLLVLAVLVVGYYIYNGSQTSTSGVNAPSAQTPKTPARPTVDVQKLLAENPPGATADQTKAFSIKVANAAVKSDSLDVSQCMPNPSVLHLKIGQSFTVKNSDSASHKLFHGQGVNVTVEAATQKVVTPAFPNPGIYGYACDNKINGIFFVVP